MIGQIARLALPAALALGGAAASAEVLVVRALGNAAATYAPGRSLPDTANLTLRAGDSVTILTARGTRTFRGPGRFSVAAPATSSRIANAAAPRSRTRIGAVRGPASGSSSAAPSGPPIDPWQVDVLRGGVACVVDPANIILWRPDATARLRLGIGGEGVTRTISWPAGAATLRWPAAVPVRPGADYRILPRGGRQPASLRLVAIPETPAGNQAIAAALIRNGCIVQLDRLLAALPPG